MLLAHSRIHTLTGFQTWFWTWWKGLWYRPSVLQMQVGFLFIWIQIKDYELESFSFYFKGKGLSSESPQQTKLNRIYDINRRVLLNYLPRVHVSDTFAFVGVRLNAVLAYLKGVKVANTDKKSNHIESQVNEHYSCQTSAMNSVFEEQSDSKLVITSLEKKLDSVHTDYHDYQYRTTLLSYNVEEIRSEIDALTAKLDHNEPKDEQTTNTPSSSSASLGNSSSLAEDESNKSNIEINTSKDDSISEKKTSSSSQPFGRKSHVVSLINLFSA